jgi:S-adenosylmethionine:tRNA ribosyltransferase-isomerase
MKAATAARSPAQRRLLVIDEFGCVHHCRPRWLASWLRPSDVVVANDAATLPASLTGTHARTGAAIEVRLAGRRSLDPRATDDFLAVVFGAGDYRTVTERRPQPPAMRPGDELRLGPLTATVAGFMSHPRLLQLQFAHRPGDVWAGIARHGRPVQYAHVPEPLAIWDTWTSIAAAPAAFEPPSAGFVLDWALLRAIRIRGARFATLTHAAGLSSTGDDALDARLPFDEPYAIPTRTAALVDDAHQRGGRVVAIGTTVVRALEHAADGVGGVRAGTGLATNRIGPDTDLRVVDAIVSGMHEPGTSHFALLGAFQDGAVLAAMAEAADAAGYLGHEFGDATLIARHTIRHATPPDRTARCLTSFTAGSEPLTACCGARRSSSCSSAPTSS